MADRIEVVGESLTRGRIAAFAGVAIPLSLLNLPILTFIGPYYGETLGLGVSACGWVFLVVRTLDALLDILVGRISDSLSLAFGRRRIVIAIGTPLLAGASWLLCFPGSHVSLVYFGAAVSIFYIGWTLIQVPHMSWGQDLARDAYERGRMSAWRETGTLIGMLLAAALPMLMPRAPDVDMLTHTVRTLGGTGVGLLLLSAALALVFVPDRAPDLRRGAQRLGLLTLLNWPGLPFAVASFATINFGIGIYISVVYLLVGKDLGLADNFLTFVVAQYVTSIALNGLLAKAARLWNTPLVIALTSTVFCAGIVIMAFSASNVILGFISFMLVGVGIGALLVLPPAMIAGLAKRRFDIEGVDRTGEHLGLLNLANKLGLAFGMGLGLILFTIVPSGNPDIHPMLSAARIVGCYVPACLVMVTVACILAHQRRAAFQT